MLQLRILPALASILLLGSTPFSQGDAAPSVRSGPALGIWELPRPGNPGFLRGKITTGDGTELFSLGAVVVRSLPLAPFGTLMGKVEVLHGPAKGTSLPLTGTWREVTPGSGRFQATVVKPRGPRPPLPVLDLRGRFNDPDPMLPPPGTFRGRWMEKVSGR